MMKDIKTHRTIIEILRAINESDTPVGGRTLSAILAQRGYPIGERAVRYYLTYLDLQGYTVKVGHLGRVLTDKGVEELNEAIVGDRVGFVVARIEELIYQTTLDLARKSGDVIVNVATIDKNDYDAAVEAAGKVIDAGYTVSPRVRIIEEGDRVGAILVPYGSLGLVTMCSMTVDGIFVKHGIPTSILYGGVLSIEDTLPSVYTDVIAYRGTSLDPIAIFTSRRMTSILDAATTGRGGVLANIRLVPAIAQDAAKELLHDAKKLGIVGWVTNAKDDSFGIPLGEGMMGINMYAGVNPMAALYELGINVKVYSISSLMNVRLLKQRI